MINIATIYVSVLWDFTNYFSHKPSPFRLGYETHRIRHQNNTIRYLETFATSKEVYHSPPPLPSPKWSSESTIERTELRLPLTILPLPRLLSTNLDENNVHSAPTPLWGSQVQRLKHNSAVPAGYVLHDELVTALNQAIVVELETSQQCGQGGVVCVGRLVGFLLDIW